MKTIKNQKKLLQIYKNNKNKIKINLISKQILWINNKYMIFKKIICHYRKNMNNKKLNSILIRYNNNNRN